MKTSTFYSLAPRLRSASGHDLAYHAAVETATRQLGLEFQALVAKDCAIDLPSAQWRPYFKQFFWDLSRLLWKQKDASLYFVETFSGAELIKLTASCLLFANKKTSVCLLFRYGLPQLYKNGRLHMFFTKVLAKRLGSRFIAVTDSEKIREGLAEALKRTVTVMPIPHTEHFPAAVSGDKPLFWWPGPPRPQKGLAEMEKLARHKEASLVDMVAAKQSGLPITLINDVLSRPEYCEQMSKSAVILLPYDPKTYQYGTSGILVEAVIAGKMPVVKAGSWLAAELERHNLSELIVDFDHPEFFSHVLSLLQSNEVQTKLRAMQAAYQEFHSITTYAYTLEKLLCRITG
jgi:hypothetical protein